MIVDQRKTFVRTLRVISEDQDKLALRSRLERNLGILDLCPLRLPPSAILCIRRLSDPAPGRLSENGIDPQGHARWEEAARARVAGIIARAARPAHGPVPANSEALLFSSRAELLACLANDWCEGRIAERWWWQSIIRDADPVRVAVEAWLNAPEHVPAALHNLARRKRVLTFVRTLNENDVRRLRSTLMHTFGLHQLHSTFGGGIVRDGRDEGQPMTASEVANANLFAMVQSRPVVTQLPPSAPWRQWVPESGAQGLDFDQQSLLGIGLMLQRAPAVVRSASFAQQVLAWHREAAAPSGDAPHIVLPKNEREISATHSRTREVALQEDGTQPLQTDFASTPSRGATDDECRSVQGSSSPVPRASLGPQPRMAKAPETDTAPTSGEPSDIRPETKLESPLTARREVFDEDVSLFPSTVDDQSLTVYDEQIETELGGLFYLINLGLRLNLYADFTKPLEPCIDLPLWDFIALVGGRLLRGQCLDDPVWGLLARLAGRVANEPPGWHFEPVDDWRIPAEWLKPFAEPSIWNWSVEQERLRVVHPEGFCIIDVRATGDPNECLKNETQRYAAIADIQLQKAELLPADDVSPLERWLNWLVPFVAARLQRALGLSTLEDVALTLLRSRARVSVTATHLEIHMALTDLPIQIRLAGLDRDPGWVPAAGRFISFQYA